MGARARARARGAASAAAGGLRPRVVAARAAAEPSTANAANFKLKFLYLEKNIGFAVDQVVGKSQHLSPLTQYFFWPRDDAWEELKSHLESMDYISEAEKIELLNTTTEIINYWQEEGESHSLEDAREAFPDCIFMGA